MSGPRRRPLAPSTATPKPDPRLSRPDMAAQLVADIIKQKVDEVKQEKVERQQQVQRRRRHSRYWYFLGLLPVLLGLTVWNLSRAGEPPTVFTPEEVDAGIRFRIFLAAQAVQAYRDSAGHWPADLGAVGMADQGLTYRLVDSTYAISDTSHAVPLEYHGGDNVALFADAYGVLARRRR